MDDTRDIRTPTHELTIVRDVLRTRRRIAGQSPDWALSADGVRALRQTGEADRAAAIQPAVATDREGKGEDVDDVENLPSVDYADIDAILARSDAAIKDATQPGALAAVEYRKRTR